jgi:hypothetical protein
VSKRYLELLFTLALLAAVGAAVYTARLWEIKARLFPWAIGIPLLVMLVAITLFQIAALRRGTDTRKAPEASSSLAPAEESAETEAEREASAAEARLERRRGLQIVGWLLGFLAAIWVLGFTIGGTLCSLAYLKLAAKERWPISLAISAGTAIFFWLMINQLLTPLPDGKLFDTLGIDQDWSGPLSLVLTALAIVLGFLNRGRSPSVPPPAATEAS